MGHLVCVALRNEEAGAPFLEALDVDRRPRRDDEPPHRHRLGHEAVEVVVGDGRVKPDSDLRDVGRRGNAVEEVPHDVVARAVEADARQLEDVAEGRTNTPTPLPALAAGARYCSSTASGTKLAPVGSGVMECGGHAAAIGNQRRRGRRTPDPYTCTTSASLSRSTISCSAAIATRSTRWHFFSYSEALRAMIWAMRMRGGAIVESGGWLNWRSPSTAVGLICTTRCASAVPASRSPRRGRSATAAGSRCSTPTPSTPRRAKPSSA